MTHRWTKHEDGSWHFTSEAGTAEVRRIGGKWMPFTYGVARPQGANVSLRSAKLAAVSMLLAQR